MSLPRRKTPRPKSPYSARDAIRLISGMDPAWDVLYRLHCPVKVYPPAYASIFLGTIPRTDDVEADKDTARLAWPKHAGSMVLRAKRPLPLQNSKRTGQRPAPTPRANDTNATGKVRNTEKDHTGRL